MAFLRNHSVGSSGFGVCSQAVAFSAYCLPTGNSCPEVKRISCLLSLCACTAGREGQERRAAAYRTDTVTLSDRTLRSGYTATIRGYQTVEIRPQVSGQITDIRMREGDAVRKGSVLFVIDQAPYKAAYDIAVANVKSAEAALSTARLIWESNKGLLEEDVVSEFDLQAVKEAIAKNYEGQTIKAAYVKEEGEAKIYKVTLAAADGKTSDVLFNEQGEVLTGEEKAGN